MLLFFKSEQFGLFSAPVHVGASVRADGTVIAPHTRIQKVKLKHETAPRHKKLDSFISAHGGVDRLSNTLSSMTAPQRQRLIVEMAKLDDITPEQVAAKLVIAQPVPTAGETPDLFSAPTPPEIEAKPSEPATEPAEPATKPEITEHVTGRGKTLRGVVRHDLSADEAKAIDEYTFKKDGGWFIREKHLGTTPAISRAKAVAESMHAAPLEPHPIESATPAPTVEHGPFGVPAGISKPRRREINQKAFAIVNSGKDITDSDRAVLRQYSGNGGCGDSLNEFYTDPEVATAMWSVLGRLGVASGTVLEPSVATGVFAHTAPPGIRVTGVELDPTSAAIAEVLHGDRHEIINSSLERFATADGDRQFDAVIGNAPFGLRGSLIKDDKPELSTAEAYFLDTSLDKCKPGGVVAMIVPTGVIDSSSGRKVRQRLLCKGEFLGAVRMPNTAFEHSHTEVTTDIVFFRKRPDDVAAALKSAGRAAMKKLGVWDEDYLSGNYFEGRGADSVFGTMEAGWRAKAGIGNDITVAGSMIGVPDSISTWQPDEFKTPTPTVQEVVDALDDDGDRKRVLGAAVKRNYVAGKVGDTKTVDGIEYILQGNPPRWHRVDEFMQSADVTDAQQLARDIESAIAGGGQASLAERVQAYIDAHGNPGKNKTLLLAASQDRVLYRLIGAVKPDGTLSDVVSGATVQRVEGSFETAAQSLAIEHDNGLFTVADLAARMDKPLEDVEDHLFASSDYAYAGDGRWTTMDIYLTGDLWPKLDSARAALAQGELREGVAEKYALQAKRLEDAIDPKSLEDVDIQVNSAFLPTTILEAYLNEKKNSGNEWERKHPDISIKFADAWYTVTGGSEYSSAQKLLTNYLNRDGVGKKDLPDIQALNEDFKAWLLTSRYRDEVEELYNRKFRGFVQKEFSDATIDIPGMNTDGLKQYQYAGLRWAMAAGKGIIAADVGLGKTVRGLMLARMAKINGTAQRPTFVVPKSVLANWVAEAERWFPGSRCLVIGETYTRDADGMLKSKPDDAATRARKLHDMVQNDYDFIFISQPTFSEIDIDPITKGQYVNSDFWVQRGDKKGNVGDKKLKKIREAYEQAIANREFQKRSDAIYWNDLGVDMLLVDEGQNFKNLFSAKARFGSTPKFLGGQGESMRAFDLNMKTRYLREHNDGKGIYLLSATPTKNSPLEIYSMLSHIAPEAFENIGIRNSEEFLDRFCLFVEDKVLTTTGTIEDAMVTAGFKNLGELREIMRKYIDRKTAADVGLVLPSRDDQMHLVDMNAEQQAVYAGLRQDLIDSAKEKDATGDAHIFSIMSKMGKAALDLELLDPEKYVGEVSPKYEDAAKVIAAGAKDGGQVVFCDSVQAHQKIVEALVRAGMDRKRIAIINASEAESSSKRQNIADAFNAGKFDAVVGNTATMGEGVNLQKKTTDIHHFDFPWDPASMQQRNGRGLRQGNINEAVRIHSYMSKGSFDGYRYQSMMAKKDWQDILWTGGDTVENLAREGKLDRSDLLIMMSADPDAERAKFEADKAAAAQRYGADQTRDAAYEFKRLQLKKQSYGELKNKDNASAARLRSQIDQATNKLVKNKYFIAKEALTSKVPVVIHPETGAALSAGVGLDVAEKNGTIGKWVISSINPISGNVSMRRYGELGNARAISVPLKEMDTGVTTFNYVEADEQAVIATKLSAAAEDSVGSAVDLKSLKGMPSAVIHSNYKALQSRLKEGLRDYKWSSPYGGMGFINAEGNPVAAETYEAHKLAASDQHDIMLPTDEHRAKAIAAYIADEKAKQFSNEYVSSGRRHSRPTQKFVQKMPGKFDQRTNRWGAIGKELFGEHFEKEAQAAFHSEQGTLVRHAKTFPDALALAAPMATMEQYGTTPRWPRRALALLYAKAKHDGDLDKPFESVQPKKEAYGRQTNVIPKELWRYNNSGRDGNAASDNPTVNEALVRLAEGNGHKDLAAAMIVSWATAKNAGAAAGKLLNMPISHDTVTALRYLAGKYPDVGRASLADLGMRTYRQNSHINNNDLARPLDEMFSKFEGGL